MNPKTTLLMSTRASKLFASLILFFLPLITLAQTEEVEMADTMKSNGKIYVVVAVLGIVLAGILIYLISIDKKVRNLENKRKS
jgi:positive regulator of sigma E activity